MSGGKWSELELEKRQQAMFDVVLDQVIPTMDPARAGERSETTAEPPRLELMSNGEELEPAEDAGAGVRRYNGKCRCGRKVSVAMPRAKNGQCAARAVRTGQLNAIAAELFGRCPDCRAWIDLRGVRGTYNAEVRCDARCENATGPNCECQCGGANHGAAHG